MDKSTSTEQQVKPLLASSITPCFRMKPYLKKFLEELPKQTIFDQIEIVLDHNEPDAEEIAWVKEFQAKYPGRINHIIVPKVDPIGTSMNRCIRQAKSDLVTIWNVDDLRTPRSMEIQVGLLDNPAYGIAFGDYRVVRSFGATDGSIVDNQPVGQEMTRSMITGPFFMFRKSLCEKAGMFDEQLKSGADFDLSIRLGFHAKAIATTELLGYYLNEGKGASTRPNSKQPMDRTIIELRYGIYDKIDYDYISFVNEFDVSNVIQEGVRVPVTSLVPDYAKIISDRKSTWLAKGRRKYILKKIFFYKQIRNFLSKSVKKLK